MQNNSSRYNEAHNASLGVEDFIQKGQAVCYEAESAYVITAKPLLVIKTKDRVICGALRRHLSIGGHRLDVHDQ